MKKIITAALTVIMIICILPVPASAEKNLEAPTVQYKLINHDEIALRWTEVDGADGYYVYRTDVDTGKTVRYKEYIKDTAYDVKRLKASTDYIFKVAAVSENDGQLNIGRKSNGTNLTTPDEWYYFQRNEYVPSKNTTETIIERWHYNMTGMETFDRHIIADTFYNDNPHYAMYILKIFQDHGFVYFKLGGPDPNRSHDEAHFLYCMKNDGTNLEKISYLNDYSEYSVITDKKTECTYVCEFLNRDAWYFSQGEPYDGEYGYVKKMFDNYKTNPDDFIFEDWSLYSTAEIRCNCFPTVYFEESKCEFSGIAVDGENVYFLSEPLYNITDETDSTVYRVKIGDQDNDIFAEQVMCIPKDETLIYGNPNNGSMKLFCCDGEYLYYRIYGRKTSEKDNYYTFYRISLNEKTVVPQKLISVDSYSGVEINNGYIYITDSKEIKRYDLNNAYVTGGEKSNIPNILYRNPSNIKDSEKYYRIKTDGTEFEEQDEPFEWRY